MLKSKKLLGSYFLSLKPVGHLAVVTFLVCVPFTQVIVFLTAGFAVGVGAGVTTGVGTGNG